MHLARFEVRCRLPRRDHPHRFDSGQVRPTDALAIRRVSRESRIGSSAFRPLAAIDERPAADRLPGECLIVGPIVRQNLERHQRERVGHARESKMRQRSSASA